MRGVLEWAQVRTLAAEGVSQREIARRLGINRRTVIRLAHSDGPPHYRRPALGSQLDPLEPVLRRLVEEWPQIKAPRVAEILRLEHGFSGSERLVREHLRRLRPPSVRPAQTLESFLEGHVRAFELFGGVPRECVYDNLRSVVARREREEVVWNQRFLHLRGHYAFHSSACTPETPREKGSVEAAVRHLKSGFWPARRFRDLRELDDQYVDWRDGVCNSRIHASGRFPVAERLAEERATLRPLPPAHFDPSGYRSARVPIDGYLKHGRSFYRAPVRLVHERVELRFDRDEVWIVHRGAEVARYERSYEQGVWLPPPIMRPEPPAPPRPAHVAPVEIAPPELAEYAELCA